MKEQNKNSEILATPEQAQSVVDQVDRITEQVKTRPGIGIKNHSAPSKMRRHEGMLFIRNPEGQRSIDDPNAIKLASVSIDHDDGSQTSFGVELTVEDGMRLTKHIYPPEPDTYESDEQALAEGNYSKVLLNAATQLVSANQDRDRRIEERSLGLHLASSAEAAELIIKLQATQPAPERAY